MVEGALDQAPDGWPGELEIGVAGLAIEGEDRSGDLAVFAPYARGGLAVVIDGLGHGDDAADASAIAERVIRRHADDPPATLLSRCHEALRKSRGVKVVARDEGPGIEDLERALTDGYTTGGGLGLGLPGARRLVDEFDIDTGPGKGTTVTLIKWAQRG